ncbi:MAG: hypothetical protein PVS3B2_00400 [Candidatus Dormibacteraceae bacterium]
MPMGWVAAIGAGASLLGSAMSSNAATSAANTQANAANNATAAEQAQYQQTRTDLAPYMQQGTMALGDINKFMANPSMVTQLPGYQFQMQQGINAIDNSASASGLTGNTLRALSDYGQGTAASYSNTYWNQLMQMANLGQTSAAGVGNIGASTANSIGSNIIGAGNAIAAGQVGSASAINTGIGNGVQNWLLASSMQNNQQYPGMSNVGGGYYQSNAPWNIGPVGP